MGSATQVRVINMALSKLGAKRITTISDDTVSARAAVAVYTEILDEVLMESPWTFAQKRVALAELGTDPVWEDDGMTVAYGIPTDMLKLNYTNMPSAIVRVEAVGILSDTSSLEILYTYRATDTTKYSTMFVTALATRLASEMAFGLTNSKTAMEYLMKEYEDIRLPRAIAADSQQGSPRQMAQNEWLGSRTSGSGGLSGQTGWETWYPV